MIAKCVVFVCLLLVTCVVFYVVFFRRVPCHHFRWWFKELSVFTNTQNTNKVRANALRHLCTQWCKQYALNRLQSAYGERVRLVMDDLDDAANELSEQTEKEDEDTILWTVADALRTVTERGTTLQWYDDLVYAIQTRKEPFIREMALRCTTSLMDF
jgi:hypothetical protein